MVDDTRWNEAVGDERTAGRNARCFIAHSHATAAAHANSQGLRFREPGAIARPNIIRDRPAIVRILQLVS
jgi:hypothetical protein